MEIAKIEIEELQKTQDDASIEQLNELQLALVGGGAGVVVIG